MCVLDDTSCSAHGPLLPPLHPVLHEGPLVVGHSVLVAGLVAARGKALRGMNCSRNVTFEVKLAVADKRTFVGIPKMVLSSAF